VKTIRLVFLLFIFVFSSMILARDCFFSLKVPLDLACSVNNSGKLLKQNSKFDIFDAQIIENVHLTLAYIPGIGLKQMQEIGQEVAAQAEPFDLTLNVANAEVELFDEWGVLYCVFGLCPESPELARLMKLFMVAAEKRGLECLQAKRQHITVLAPVFRGDIFKQKSEELKEVGLDLHDKKKIKVNEPFVVDSFVVQNSIKGVYFVFEKFDFAKE